MTESTLADLIVRNEGSIFLLCPVTPAGSDWIEENIGADAQTWGTAIVVEHRYIGNIVDGAVRDGLEVR